MNDTAAETIRSSGKPGCGDPAPGQKKVESNAPDQSIRSVEFGTMKSWTAGL